MLWSHATATRAKRIRSADERIAEALRRSALWHAVARALETRESHVLASSAMKSMPLSVLAEGPSAESAELVLLAPEGALLWARLLTWLKIKLSVWRNRGFEGAPAYYFRICVACSFHTLPRGLPYRPRRNTGARQTVTLGVHEPLAYIGAWLARGPSCWSLEEHVAWRPLHAETRAYALRVGVFAEHT